MKDLLLNFLIKNIKKYNNYDEKRLKEIRYGLACFYLQITKTIVIFSLSILLGYFKTLLLFMLLYTILRTTGYGVHAKKSWQCWLCSLTVFILIPLLIQNININKKIIIIISVLSIILIMLYAPADTEKRPLYNKKKRKICKIITSLESIAYFILIILLKNKFVIKCLAFSILLEAILIIPLTYKLFGVKYNNYKKGGKK